MIGLLTSALVEAATFERDLRLERAATELAKGGLDGSSRQKIVISCQCWSAIVTWLETDRFESFLGGESPAASVGEDGQPAKDQPIIKWPELEAAAERALAAVGDMTEADRIRRARLTAVHARVARMRRDVDWLNAEFRKSRMEKAA